MARVKISLSRSALTNNYRIISQKVPALRILPMIKANAYGHDSAYVARSLLPEKNLYGFGVATFAEAMELRQKVPEARQLPILVFSDSGPWNDVKKNVCLANNLEPVLSDLETLKLYQNGSVHPHASKIRAHVEVNSGMNRMGIPPDSFSLIRFEPASIFTHLADAETPHSRLTKMQISCFRRVAEETKQRFPRALLHFSNSSAIWNAAHYPLTRAMDLVRPGLSLYGIRPFVQAKNEGLKRVMHVCAPILNRIHLKYGDRVGYGGTYRCKKPRGEWIMTLGAGYADGVFRSLGGKGFAVIKSGSGKKKFPIIGRVSMDLMAVSGNLQGNTGSELELWGDLIDPYEQAAFAGTIPYEMTTRMGGRVERIYE